MLPDGHLACVTYNGIYPIKKQGNTGVMWWDWTLTHVLAREDKVILVVMRLSAACGGGLLQVYNKPANCCMWRWWKGVHPGPNPQEESVVSTAGEGQASRLAGELPAHITEKKPLCPAGSQYQWLGRRPQSPNHCVSISIASKSIDWELVLWRPGRFHGEKKTLWGGRKCDIGAYGVCIRLHLF